MPYKKISRLKNILKSLKSAVLAYSGGVDSTFLLEIARQVLGPKLLAVIARSETYPEDEARFAVKFVKDNGIKHKVIHTSEFKDERFISNPPDRCYYCKLELFSKLRAIARSGKYAHVMDGTNASDLSDYRPGARAKKELGVKSPLEDAGITKEEIRKYSKELGLPTWNKPSFACLASRIAYGTRISKRMLRNIENGEKYIRRLGLKQVRVRHHGNLARIEVDKENIVSLVEEGIADKIDRKFRDLGYKYVTIDLTGYRTGSMNEELPYI